MSEVRYDIIVVGAGHAGIEAALASARLGMNTLLVTSNIDRIGYMSCNPSIGGLGKGHMVRELDILGGEMSVAADKTCIQYKRLNSSKGPAVRGTRVQNDKHKYNLYMKQLCQNQANLSVKEFEVKALLLSKPLNVSIETCEGVVLNDGSKIYAKAVIITTGTFMNGVMHVGDKQQSGGRVGDKASIGLSDQLKHFGFDVRRLKTGTPARLFKDSIDWSKTIAQWGDEKYYPFSFRSPKKLELPQIACYLSRTTEKTHDIIRSNIHKSPMYCGLIEGVGPRYCPSIEDKVSRFADRTSHQTFLEPEGLDTDLIYLQGISTSLPREVQDDFLRTIAGLENVKIAMYGYAVEYDFIEPTQIKHSLETRVIENLFLAGQINGTSGYEEAAVQGLIAGINATHKIKQKDPLILHRNEAYIGVLIDDLVTKGTREPYRMLTSRAEHRLVLREDNALDRLVKISENIGLLNPNTLEQLFKIEKEREILLYKLQNEKIFPNKQTQDLLVSINTTVLNKSISYEELLRRPEIDSLSLLNLGFDLPLDPNIYEPIEINVKYDGYIKKQKEIINQTKKFEELVLPKDIHFKDIKGLSAEEIEKLTKIKPHTLGQAQRISGVNPSAIQAIMIYLKSRSFNLDTGDRAKHGESTV